MPEFSNPDAYELWMGRWSTRLAPSFVEFAHLPKGGHFLDVGSGTGALAAALLAGVEDGTVVGIEPSEPYVEYCRERMRDKRLRFEHGDALTIPFEDESFHGSLALLILQELPNAPRAVKEMCRVTRPGGCVATSQWNFKDGMPMLALFWDTVTETIDTEAAREAAAKCMTVDYPDEAALRHLWEDLGLTEVETKTLDVEMEFAGFEDYWASFLTDVTPTSSYVGRLSEDKKAVLRDHLRQKITGEKPDRPFTLATQALSVRGKVP